MADLSHCTAAHSYVILSACCVIREPETAMSYKSYGFHVNSSVVSEAVEVDASSESSGSARLGNCKRKIS